MKGEQKITIKDLAIDIKEIEQLAKGYESYERDEFTGEILSGGNTFVFVNYDYGLKS